MELLILGSNSAAFAYGRHHTAQLLKYQSKYFLIDCGEGTQIQIKKFGVKLSRIHCIVITHLHGDHYLGLTGLLNTMHLFGRETPLKLIGPPGLKDILSLQFKMSQTTLTYPIEFTEWVPETNMVVYQDNKLSIETFPLDHKIPCSGYLFKENNKPYRLRRETLPEKLAPVEISQLKRGEDVLKIDGTVKFPASKHTLPPRKSYSYAFCSDTKYIPELANRLKDVDVIYHEASFLEEMAERATQTKHSTARQAATVAKDAGAQQLLLGHFSSRYKNLEPFLEEATEIFPNTALAIEGQTFQIDEVG